jgi:type II secretory pathway pseudopilin PulG
MKHRTRGFTLIEQIAAITLAGATSAVAVPALVGLQAQAEATTLASLANAAGSAMALNYGGCLVTGQRVRAGTCVAIRNCRELAELLLTDLPEGYRIDDQPLGQARGPGEEGRCTLSQAHDGASAAFRGIAAGR